MNLVTKMTNLICFRESDGFDEIWQNGKIARLNRHDMAASQKVDEHGEKNEFVENDKFDFISPNLLTELYKSIWRKHCSILYTFFQQMLCSRICRCLS